MIPQIPLGALADAFAGLYDLELKESCEKSLMKFTGYCWDITDPGEPLVGGWAMEAIAEHLEASFHGHIKRLLITVPPGFSKSSLTNVFFPLWVWIQPGEAHNRFIHASYEQGIPERDNLKCRNIIQNEKFSKYWKDRFKLVVPNTVGRFENDHTGWKMATAVGAKLIGHRGNYIFIDDPNDPKVENISGADRIAAVRWFRETVPTRLNNMKRDRIIVIQQRLHMEDIAGVALSLEHENYVHLNIPMEYEPRLYINAFMLPSLPDADADPDEAPDDEIDPIVTLFDDDAQAAIDADPTCIFWSDPRTKPNQLAWPERFGRREVSKLKMTLGPTMVEAQLQQRPVRRGGNIIKTADWITWKEEKYPACKYVLATLDTAYTEDTMNDPSGMCIWGLFEDEYTNPKILLIYAWTDYLELHDLVRRTLHVCTTQQINYGDDLKGFPRYPVDSLLIEGKASGLSVQQEIGRLTTQGHGRTLVTELVPSKLLRADKVNRLTAVSHLFRGGMIYAPDKIFANEVIDQVGNFPFATHDEYADCTSMGLRWFRDQGFAPTRDEIFEADTNLKAFKPPMKPLYGGVG